MVNFRHCETRLEPSSRNLAAHRKRSGYDGTREFYYTSSEQMGLTGCTPEEFVYNCTLLIEDGYVDGAATVLSQVIVRRLTSSGHDFLDDIRDPGVWKQVRPALAVSLE